MKHSRICVVCVVVIIIEYLKVVRAGKTLGTGLNVEVLDARRYACVIVDRFLCPVL